MLKILLLSSSRFSLFVSTVTFSNIQIFSTIPVWESVQIYVVPDKMPLISEVKFMVEAASQLTSRRRHEVR
jgi:hypothetical protein